MPVREQFTQAALEVDTPLRLAERRRNQSSLHDREIWSNRTSEDAAPRSDGDIET